MKRILVAAVMAMNLLTAFAEKQMYIPREWRNSTDTLLWAEEDPDNQYTWSKSRSVEGDNVIVLWDNLYGSTAPNKLAKSNFYYVDIDDLLKKCEEFYQLECNELGFVDPENSNVAKYKVMVLMNHSTTWTCYGGGYDYQVPALWLNPATCKPVGSAVAHEVGHSFHYMCYSEDSNHGALTNVQTGFHGAVGNGATIWETTANWQALQSYPGEYFTMSGMADVFEKSHNYTFTHEWMRYQAYPFFTYLTDYYDDITVISDVWNTHETVVKDFNQVLMNCKSLKTKDLYKLHFDFAMHVVTWDIEAARPYVKQGHIGKFNYMCSQVGERQYQVAYASCPQGTGFNVIPLQVPEAGTTITSHLTALKNAAALAAADPGQFLNGNTAFEAVGQSTYNKVSTPGYRGFRMGYVALMEDGTRQYFSVDSVYCTGTAEVTEDYALTVPEGVSRLWLVVAPSLRGYIQHKWDENVKNDDQWPYILTLDGTDLGTSATVYMEPEIDGRIIQDATIAYDVYFPADASNYSGTTVTVGGKAAATLGTAFQMQPSEIAAKMMNYTSSGPTDGKVMFYPSKSDGTLIKSGSTANGYGHWFTKGGLVTQYANSAAYVFSEFSPTALQFSIGQYPARCKNGDAYTIAQALRYRKGSDYAQVTFVFNIHIDNSRTGAELKSVDYENTDAILAPAFDIEQDNATFDLSGRRVAPARKGIVIKNGKLIFNRE